ncbi:MAG: efflux RND transporter periplasmic adaptor subunit [Alphaproteobacteria bacterium]|nr:efflux RND transporter periplasmic adaptor subunit [Alphaproteobacteria bacterium]
MRHLLPVLGLLGACKTEPVSAVIDHVPRVEVVAVTAPPPSLDRTLLSTLSAARDATLTPMVPGVVLQRPVQAGDRVRKGDPILVLDDREARANLLAARAARQDAEAVLAEARAQAGRVRTLGDGASKAQQDSAGVAVERASAAVDAARAQEQLAAVTVDRMTLSAPFDGEVAWIAPEVGESVGGGLPAARVVDATDSRVVVGLLQDEVGPASTAEATFEIVAGSRRVPATLAWVSPAADPRTLDWRAELTVPGHPFPPGTPVQVVLHLPLDLADGVLPPQAVTDGSVWRLDGTTVSQAPVMVVGEVRQGLLVTGLPVGTEVVRYHAEPLADGDEVVRVEPP